MDKTELAGRQINVELAKPPSAVPAGKVPREAAKAAVAQGLTEGEEVAEGQGEGKKARKPRNKVSPVSKRLSIYPALIASHSVSAWAEIATTEDRRRHRGGRRRGCWRCQWRSCD